MNKTETKSKTNKSPITKFFKQLMEKIQKEKNPLEAVLGIFIIIFALYFLLFAFSKADIRAVKGYDIIVELPKLGGLNVGGDAKLHGVKIGTVKNVKIDETNYNVVLTVSLKKHLKLPIDSTASVISNGLLGEKYLRIQPGSANIYLKANDSIQGKDYKTLEDIVSDFIFSDESSNKETETTE